MPILLQYLITKGTILVAQAVRNFLGDESVKFNFSNYSNQYENCSNSIIFKIHASASKLLLWISRPDTSQQRKTQIITVSDFPGMVERKKRNFQRPYTYDHKIMIEYLIYKQYLLVSKAGQNFPIQRNTSSYF